MTVVTRTRLTGMSVGAIGFVHIVRRDSQPHRVWFPARVHTMTEPVVAVAMGVSGSRKTTESALLAAALGCQLQEGHDLDPPRTWKGCKAARRSQMHIGCHGCV
jgi:hypothetical protein